MKAAIYARVSTFDKNLRTSSRNCAALWRPEDGPPPSTWTAVSAEQRTADRRSIDSSPMPAVAGSTYSCAGALIGSGGTSAT